MNKIARGQNVNMIMVIPEEQKYCASSIDLDNRQLTTALFNGDCFSLNKPPLLRARLSGFMPAMKFTVT